MFFEGRILLVSEALVTFRSTTGFSTNQAARNAMELKRVLEGQSSLGGSGRGGVGVCRRDTTAGDWEGRGIWVGWMIVQGRGWICEVEGLVVLPVRFDINSRS